MALTINGTTGIETNTDTGKLKFGTGDDLEIYHDGSDSYIDEVGTGSILIRSDTHVRINKQSAAESMATFNPDGSVELYHNNVKKFETTADGVTIPAAELKLQNSAAANATVQIIAGEGGHAILELLSDEADDNGDKWLIQADNNHSFYLKNKTSGSWETNLMATGNAGVSLNYDNSTHLQTTSAGGTLDGVWDINNGLKFYDGIEAKFGTGNDLIIEHDGSDSIIENQTTGGALYILNRADARLQFGANNAWKVFTDGGGKWLPYADDAHDLGQSNLRWQDVYAGNATINTSDRNLKDNITDSDLGLSFVNKLKPVSYKWKGKTRTHYGLIAQDVETLLSDISKSTADFAGFIKTDSEAVLWQSGEEEGKKAGEVRIPASTDYGLRYSEFIAPLIKAIQELSAKVAALEAA